MADIIDTPIVVEESQTTGQAPPSDPIENNLQKPSKMMTYSDSILKILLDPKNLKVEKTKSHIDEDSPLAPFFKKFAKSCEQLKTTETSIDQSTEQLLHIEELVTLLEEGLKVLAAQLSLKSDGIHEFLMENLTKRVSGLTICNHHATNFDLLSSLDKMPDGSVLFVDMIKCFMCTTCSGFDYEHSVCAKYTPSTSDDYDFTCVCTGCGLQEHRHSVCTSFTSTSNATENLPKRTCESCGLSYFKHNAQRKKHERCCTSFVANSQSASECTNCPYHRMDHIYREIYWLLNKEARREISDQMLFVNLELMNKNLSAEDVAAYMTLVTTLYRPKWRSILSREDTLAVNKFFYVNEIYNKN